MLISDWKSSLRDLPELHEMFIFELLLSYYILVNSGIKLQSNYVNTIT